MSVAKQSWRPAAFKAIGDVAWTKDGRCKLTPAEVEIEVARGRLIERTRNERHLVILEIKDRS